MKIQNFRIAMLLPGFGCWSLLVPNLFREDQPNARKVKDKITGNALNKKIIEKAKTKAKAVLENFFHAAGFKAVLFCLGNQFLGCW